MEEASPCGEQGRQTHSYRHLKEHATPPDESMELVITLPHGSSPTGDGERNSDEGALKILPYLEEALDELEVGFVSLVGTTNRDIIDLNRLRAYSHPYVQKVRKELLEAIVHVDLHSFPYVEQDEEENFLTSTGYDLRVWSQSPVVFFNTPDVTNVDFLEHVQVAVGQVGMDVVEEVAGYENYLSCMSNVLMDVPSIVIEVNEGETQDYPALAGAIATGILDFLNFYAPSPQDDELPPAADA